MSGKTTAPTTIPTTAPPARPRRGLARLSTALQAMAAIEEAMASLSPADAAKVKAWWRLEYEAPDMVGIAIANSELKAGSSEGAL